VKLYSQSSTINAIKIAHLNINSLTSKYHDVDAIITLKDIDIFCITESLLDSNNIFREFSNFSILRRDSFDSSERGIAILYRSCISAKIVSLPEISASPNCEFLCIQFQIKNNKSFLVVCIYRHTKYDLANRKSDDEFFNTLITVLKNTTLDFYILGDFNLPKPSHINPLNTIAAAN